MTGSAGDRPVESSARQLLRPPGRAVGATAVSLALLFVLFSWQLTIEGPLHRLDEHLTAELRQLAPVDDGPAELGADLGNFEVALPVLALTMAYVFWRGRRWAPPLACGLAIAAVPLLVAPLKMLFDRPGPLGGTGYYPSGHTATAVVAYGAAVLLLWPYLRGRTTRCCALLSAVALITATGSGLVVRGYHWPLDVLASCALGGLLVLGAWHLSATRQPRAEPPPRASPTPG